MNDPRTDTIGTILAETSRRLTQAGVLRPRLDARLILGHVLAVGPEVILGYPERPVDPTMRNEIDRLVAERVARRPLSQILGRREFWSLDLEISPFVLTPRPETETLIEVVRHARPDTDAALTMLDLGTGSGALLLALLSEYPRATGLGVDISDDALVVAVHNAERLGIGDRVAFRRGDWCENIHYPFDVVVCNPPYIRSGDIPGLAPEVSQHEPHLALDGGDDGLDCYRTILWQLPDVMAGDGLAVLELGQGQAPAVTALAVERGLAPIELRDDLAGIPRALALRRALEGDDA